MAAYLATAVLWIAAATRVYATIRRPDPGRVSLAIGAVCVALAFAVLATASAFDAQFNWPNGSEIVQHLLFAAATYATLLFLLFLRRNALPRRELIIQTALAVSVGISMIALFAVAPVHEQSSTNFAVDYGGDLAALLYRAVFDFYLVYCLVGIARICLRHAFTSGDGPRSASLFFVASGCVFAAVAAFAAGAGMLLRYSTGAPLLFLGSVNTVAIAVAGILAGIGILAPMPADGLLRWRRARRTCVHLHALWATLTRAVPDVVLPMPTVRSPLERVELTSTRRRIEIADALSRIRVHEHDAAVIQSSKNPPAALGQALRDASRWAPSGSTGVIAADLLQARSTEDELQQILTVAAAYGAPA